MGDGSGPCQPLTPESLRPWMNQRWVKKNSSISGSTVKVEAAWSEGASHWHTLWRVLVPITKSSFVTLGLLSFVANYNNYMWPSLITTKQSYYLISQGLRLYFIEGGAYGIKWPQIMAASTFTVMPLMILYFITQRWFIQGLSDSGVKG